LDLEYIGRQSLGLDIEIVWRTGGQLLRGRGSEGHPRDDPIAAIAEESAPKSVGEESH
jgi:hypothetical protein